MIDCGYPLVSIRIVYSPREGSFSLFHDVKYLSNPVTKSFPSFIPATSVSVGKSKLCQIGFFGLPFSSRMTKLPVPKSRPTGFLRDGSDELADDQMISPVALRSTRIPWIVRDSSPELSESGEFRLATHITVWIPGDILLYQIPRDGVCCCGTSYQCTKYNYEKPKTDGRRVW